MSAEAITEEKNIYVRGSHHRYRPGKARFPAARPRVLTSFAAHQSGRSEAEDAEASASDVRDGHHRALPTAGMQRRGSLDADVPGGRFSAPGRRHHRGLMGHACQSRYGFQSEQEDLCQDRGMAEPSDRRRASLSLLGWDRDEADVGRRSPECLAAGGQCGEFRRLPGDPWHLRGRQGRQVRLVELSAPFG